MRRFTIGVLLLLMTSSAFAEDLFTLSVPVRLAQIHPSITAFGVWCELKGPVFDPATGVPYLKLQPYASLPPVWLPLSGGAYSGTVTFVFRTEHFSTPGLMNPSNVTTAFCALQLRTIDGYTLRPYDLMSPASDDKAATPLTSHQPDTEFRSYSTQLIKP